jgi:hypothetical protein
MNKLVLCVVSAASRDSNSSEMTVEEYLTMKCDEIIKVVSLIAFRLDTYLISLLFAGFPGTQRRIN